MYSHLPFTTLSYAPCICGYVGRFKNTRSSAIPIKLRHATPVHRASRYVFSSHLLPWDSYAKSCHHCISRSFERCGRRLSVCGEHVSQRSTSYRSPLTVVMISLEGQCGIGLGRRIINNLSRELNRCLEVSDDLRISAFALTHG